MAATSHRRSKWNSPTFPVENAPDINPLRRLPIWMRLAVVAVTMSVGTLVTSRLLTWSPNSTPREAVRAPSDGDKPNSGILFVQTSAATTTRANVVVDGTIGIKVLNDHLATKAPAQEVTAEGWKHVAIVDADENTEKKIAPQDVFAGSDSGKNDVSVNTAFWTAFPMDDGLSECNTFSPEKHLVRVCSVLDMHNYRFFQLQNAQTGKWLGRSLDVGRKAGVTRTERTFQILFHSGNHQAWSVQSHTRLHLSSSASTNWLSANSFSVGPSELWMPVFGNVTTGPLPKVTGKHVNRTPAVTSPYTFDTRFTSSNTTEGPVMFLQSTRNGRFVASVDDTMWATANNATDRSSIVPFKLFADVRKRCQAARTGSSSWSRRRKAKVQADRCFGKRGDTLVPFPLDEDDPHPLLPIVGTFDPTPPPSRVTTSTAGAEGGAQPISSPTSGDYHRRSLVAAHRALASWSLLRGTQPMLAASTNETAKEGEEVLKAVDALIATGVLQDPRLGARRLLNTYFNSTAHQLEEGNRTHNAMSTERPLAPSVDIVKGVLELHEAYSQPTYRGLFHAALQRYPHAPYVMYSSLDTMYTSSLIPSLRAVERYFHASKKGASSGGLVDNVSPIRGWLIVGLRHNAEIPTQWTPLKHPSRWEGDINERMVPQSKSLDSEAIDYIIVSRGLFDWMKSIPDFVVGGMAFEGWVLNKVNLLAQKGEAMVFDATSTITAVHQQHNDGDRSTHLAEGPKTKYNMRLASENGGSSLGTVADVSLALTYHSNSKNITIYDKHLLLHAEAVD